mmetsp:Transcript_428/g.1561  ORF Transcript_428/g.1561 Transcript_428/m.1561 type:complete len:210 (-) Transcript_428:553-1182(-)
MGHVGRPDSIGLGLPEVDPPLQKPVRRRHFPVVGVVQSRHQFDAAELFSGQHSKVEDFVDNTFRQVQPILRQKKSRPADGGVLVVEVPLDWRGPIVGGVRGVLVGNRFDLVDDAFQGMHSSRPVLLRGLFFVEDAHVPGPDFARAVQDPEDLVGSVLRNQALLLQKLDVAPSSRLFVDITVCPFPEVLPGVHLRPELELVLKLVGFLFQ